MRDLEETERRYKSSGSVFTPFSSLHTEYFWILADCTSSPKMTTVQLVSLLLGITLSCVYCWFLSEGEMLNFLVSKNTAQFCTSIKKTLLNNKIDFVCYVGIFIK